MVQNAQRDYAKFSTVNAPYPTALHSLSSRSQSCSSWTAPLLGFFKMNVDAAVVDRHNRGVGVAIHNHHGQLVAAATSAISVIWRPPPQNWIKLNTDASFSSGTKSGATAVVIRDHREKVLGGTTLEIQASSSLSAKAQAVREVVIMAKNLDIQKAIIETDCQLLTQTIKSGSTIWKIDPIIQDIKMAQKTNPNCGLTWAPREGNKLAHSLAARYQIFFSRIRCSLRFGTRVANTHIASHSKSHSGIAFGGFDY